MAKSNRVKSDNKLISIENWQQADEMVREVGNMQLEIQVHEAVAKNKIDDAKSDLAEITKPIKSKIKKYVNSIEAFAATHKKDFVGKRQSKDLNFGKIGWRKSFIISVSKKTLELIKTVFSKQKAASYYRVKETVDKNALAYLTDEELAAVEARREYKEVFFVEPDIPEAVDHE